MPYTIYNNDGTILLNLPDSEVDDVTTSLYLIGKNVNNYGQYFNNNLVKLLTSFANTAGNEPANPQIGQLFFNKTTGRLTAYNGNSFAPTNGSWLSLPLTPASGDFYFNTVEDQLFIWTGTNYKLVGPALPKSAGKFSLEPSTATITTDVTYVPQPNVGLIYAYGSAIGMVSTTSFKMSTTTSILYLSTTTATQLVAGLTLFQNLDVKGNVSVGSTGTISVTNSTSATSTSTGALQVAGGVGIGGNLYVGGIVNMKTYTIATLPTGVQGMRASVSNAATTTFYSTVSTTGAYFVPVFYDGSYWRIG
jgi:hypothetical protein